MKCQTVVQQHEMNASFINHVRIVSTFNPTVSKSNMTADRYRPIVKIPI